MRAPIPPGRYRFALDLVAEHRAWFSELGSETAAAEVEVRPRAGDGPGRAPGRGSSRRPTAAERVAAAHAEGYARRRRRDRVARRRRPRGARARSRRTSRARAAIPGFTHPLLCPSVLDGIELERLADVEGLPAFAAPADEPWLYDGRIVLRAQPKRRESAPG